MQYVGQIISRDEAYKRSLEDCTLVHRRAPADDADKGSACWYMLDCALQRSSGHADGERR